MVNLRLSGPLESSPRSPWGPPDPTDTDVCVYPTLTPGSLYLPIPESFHWRTFGIFRWHSYQVRNKQSFPIVSKSETVVGLFVSALP